MKSKILDILYENQNRPVSGQVISGILGVSRTAVWKHIKSLKEDGYQIESFEGIGYTLAESDILNEYEIKKRLRNNIKFVFVKSIDSTNTLAKKIARENKDEFMFVVSETQQKGRGRLGRTFESDNKQGVWCSFILKPSMEPEKALIITVASATAVCRTLEEVCGLKTGIKWPNDIVAGKRKICGILSEMSCETGAIEFIIAGVGINISQTADDFSTEVSKTATSVLMETRHAFVRAEIISSLCYNMQEIFRFVISEDTEEIMKRWEKYSVTDGKDIKIIRNNEEINAVAEGIDYNGRLIATDENGKRGIYNSGEISIRGIMGYI